MRLLLMPLYCRAGPAVPVVLNGGPPAMLFAATRPERTAGLILYHTAARHVQANDYPFGHADPLPIPDQPGGLLHPHDGRQTVIPCDHCAVGHQAPDLCHQAP
jgi:hypothetical protein